jgi:hypothetical protein
LDVLSHSLWGLALTRRRLALWACLASGALPDIIAFAPARLAELQSGTLNLRHEARPLSAYPAATELLYNLTHSLAGLAALSLLALLLLSLLPALRERVSGPEGASLGPARLTLWLMAPWALHLAMDLPLHSAEFFPTPLLWPFSDAVFDGIPWAQPTVLIPNVLLLGLALTWARSSPEPEAAAADRR